jgi:DNA replication protein
MSKFNGFTDSETFARIPDSFFQHLLAGIEEADELKVTLHALWRLGQMEGRVHFLKEKDFSGLVPDPAPALEKAAARGTLIRVRAHPAAADTPGGGTALYFLNSPRGRAAAEALQKGERSAARTGLSAPPPERPNVFKLYEENVGPLTPMIADALKDAESTYSEAWVAEALEIAVKSNKRSWRYVEAILKRWKEEGHVQEQDRRDAQEPRGREVKRKVEDFLNR